MQETELVAQQRRKMRAGIWHAANALRVDHATSCDKACKIINDCVLVVPSPAEPGRKK